MKRDYSTSYRKKLVQQIVFSDVKKQGMDKLVGLAGPNITDYLSFVKSNGIKQAEVYENDYVNMLQQMHTFKPPIKTTVKYQDVYTADLYQDTVYDLDFCCTIKNAEHHIKKFKDTRNIITLSLRGVSFNHTIKKFCKIVSKLKPKITLNVNVTAYYKQHEIRFDNNQSYKVFQYSDTSAMLTITNF
jgi:hypothetical protein